MRLRVNKAMLLSVDICCFIDMGGVNEKFFLQDATE